ncbi:hypothetical protein M5K25_020012 [Dendrobium thyrsiflorum]|uniref:Uncharacterized protein n=1 Tax=Dendrobium thyrsiflorum TaxID=117978 RepID=A0ABD0U8T3_DENTH
MLEEMRKMREHISSGRSTTADEETDSEFPVDNPPELVTVGLQAKEPSNKSRTSQQNPILSSSNKTIHT